MAQTWTLKARWLIPVDQPAIEGGVLTVAGDRIASVDRTGRPAADLDLGDALVLPGLVNAHTHLDLGGLRGLARPEGGFTQWLRRIVAYRRAPRREEVLNAVQAGIAESLQSGTTLLGDIAFEGTSGPLLARAPLRSVVFFELIGLARDRQGPAWAKADEWLRAQARTNRFRPGLSPHAPYSVGRSLLRQADQRAADDELPLAIHLAETSSEKELLEHHAGPLRSFLEEVGGWEAADLSPDFDAVFGELAAAHQTLFIHGNYLEILLPDLARLGGRSVVYCPRTHAYFGHPPHPFVKLLQAGVNVALGTDSLASNPDLSILNEMRFLHRQRPEVPPERIVSLGTLGGAIALGWDREAGSLTPGKPADFVVLPIAHAGDPYRLLLEGNTLVTDVVIGGQWIVREGRMHERMKEEG